MQEPLILSPLGLIVLGYAVGTTVALYVLISIRRPVPPPTVMIEREPRTSDGLGCLVFVALFIGFLILATVTGS